MALLNLLRSTRAYTLPAFELAPLEFDAQADDLLVDAIVTGIGPESHIVRIVRPMPTAGELQARIEDHLRGSPAVASAVNATDELRNALAELRQSLG